MPTVKIFLQQLIQDSQDYGSDDEHMVSRVFFDLEADGKKYQGLYANIKQTVGAPFETGPLEVASPVGYKGPFDYSAFQKIVEDYYRRLVGAKGHGIHIEGATNTRMRNNRFVEPQIAEFEVAIPGRGW